MSEVKIVVDLDITAKYSGKRIRKVDALTENPMPHISIKGPEISLDAKRKLVEEITRIASEAYRMPEEKFMIHIFECPKENIAVGGALLVDR